MRNFLVFVALCCSLDRVNSITPLSFAESACAITQGGNNIYFEYKINCYNISIAKIHGSGLSGIDYSPR
jgi:hypothetical protein